MIRKTLTILSLIGLLLSAGVSYLCVIYIPLSPTSKAVIGGGVISTYRISWVPRTLQRNCPEVNTDILRDYECFTPGLAINASRQVRFGWLPAFGQRRTRLGTISVSRYPLWPPIGGSAVAILFIWWGLSVSRRRKRNKLGLCASCGYDLRGSSGHCPECNVAFDAEVAAENRRRAAQSRDRAARRLARIIRSLVRKICVGVALSGLLAGIGVWVAQGVRPIHLYSTVDFDAIPDNAVLAERVYDLKRKSDQVVLKVYYDRILGEHIRQPNAPFLMIGAAQGQLQFRWLEPTRWVDIMEEGTVLGYRYPVRRTKLIPLWKVLAVLATATALLAAVGPFARHRLKAMESCLH